MAQILPCGSGVSLSSHIRPQARPLYHRVPQRAGEGYWGQSVVTNASSDQCWENSVGEELFKLSIFNFLLTVAFAFLVTLPRR